MPFINGIGPFELIIILVIALIVVGPGRLPDVGAALGKSIREFRKAATDVKDATSLDAAPSPAPAAPAPAAPPAPAPAAVAAVSSASSPPAPVVPAAEPAAAPPVEEAVPAAAPAAPVEAAAPDISELPDPVPAADEQPTRTA